MLYVGPTTDTYSTGVCYTCKATESSSYYWEAVDSGGGEYTLTKEEVDGVIGASTEGSTAKFYNEQGAFTEVDMSGYLPLSGGNISDKLQINKDAQLFIIGRFSVSSVATFSVGSDATFNKVLNLTSSTSYLRFGTYGLINFDGYFNIGSYTRDASGACIPNSDNTSNIRLKNGNNGELELAVGRDSAGEYANIVMTQSDLGIRATSSIFTWNGNTVATVNDITTHNVDTTAHSTLFDLKENTGVAQRLVDTHANLTASSDTLGHIKVDNETITVDENGVATAHAVGHNIFDIFYSMSSKAPAGAMDLSLGTLIASCDTVFPDFWSECL